ncbi:MAG: hypothetical protein ACXAEU_07265 [Candidatus Hodarchaeales archaeon]
MFHQLIASSEQPPVKTIARELPPVKDFEITVERSKNAYFDWYFCTCTFTPFPYY